MEQQRLEQERERQERERLEWERQERDRLEWERQERERLEKERQAAAGQETPGLLNMTAFRHIKLHCSDLSMFLCNCAKLGYTTLVFNAAMQLI